MNDFYEISAALQDKFEFIKHNMSLILFGENPSDYKPDWSWDKLFSKSGNYGDSLNNALFNGNEENMLFFQKQNWRIELCLFLISSSSMVLEIGKTYMIPLMRN